MEILPVSSHRKTSISVETKNLSFKLKTKPEDINWLCCGLSWAKNMPQSFILKDVNCEANGREMTAIAGPSGAGKTTLLEILAGKISPTRVSGQVLVNGSPMDISKTRSFQKISAYVTQFDALFPLLTVQETLVYSALLRRSGGPREAVTRAKQIMNELGLSHVAGSRVGTGISGGERRRVSIGVDLVHDPDAIFVDEPTSGLDSVSALQVASILKEMAIHRAKTVVITIHQPGSRILELFDRIILLSDGHVAHNGTLSHLRRRLEPFASPDRRLPKQVNVLEFAIDFVETLAGNFSGKENERLEGFAISGGGIEEKPFSYANARSGEVLILGRRFCSNILRTKQLFAARVLQALIAGLVLGTIYLNAGNETGRVALQTEMGFFAFSLTFLLSSTTEGLPIFLQERRIMMSETERGAYRVSSYVLANALVFVPFLLVVSLLYAAPVYWLVGLSPEIGSFAYFSLVVWAVLLVSNSFVSCFSALVPNFIMGTSVISGLMGSFFLFSGYFISKESLPSYWVFMHYVSLFKYPFECFLINEFGGERGKRKCIEESGDEGKRCNLYGDGFLRQQGLKESLQWTNLAVMLGFIVGYRVLCFLILWFRCYRTRN